VTKKSRGIAGTGSHTGWMTLLVPSQLVTAMNSVILVLLKHGIIIWTLLIFMCLSF